MTYSIFGLNERVVDSDYMHVAVLNTVDIIQSLFRSRR